jgi:hypothetical protein
LVDKGNGGAVVVVEGQPETCPAGDIYTITVDIVGYKLPDGFSISLVEFRAAGAGGELAGIKGLIFRGALIIVLEEFLVFCVFHQYGLDSSIVFYTGTEACTTGFYQRIMKVYEN